MTCRARSSITTTAGSLSLSFTSGASTRTAIPVAPIKISAEKLLNASRAALAKPPLKGINPLFLQRFAAVTGKRQHGRQPFCQPHAAGRQAKQGNGFRLYGIHG